MAHEWVLDFRSSHTGRVWYTCKKCDASAWANADEGTEHLLPKNCAEDSIPVKAADEIKYFVMEDSVSILPLPGCLSYQQALDMANRLCPDGYEYIMETHEVLSLRASIEALKLGGK